MKYIISTLGCKVNQYETQAMEGFLNERGFERAVPGEIADAVIVNTCAVTAESGRKSRQTIRRLRDENPGAVLAVCGCYSQIEPDAVQAIGADVIFGAADREKLVDAVVKACTEGEGTRDIDEPFKRREIERHVEYTGSLLSKMVFEGDYEPVPRWASMHHELLDGSGYPDHVSGDQIPPEVRLLTILDVYDALTAEDRPYKPPMPAEKAFAILQDMADHGKLDGALLAEFRESGAWKKQE